MVCDLLECAEIRYMADRDLPEEGRSTHTEKTDRARPRLCVSNPTRSEAMCPTLPGLIGLYYFVIAL